MPLSSLKTGKMPAPARKATQTPRGSRGTRPVARVFRPPRPKAPRRPGFSPNTWPCLFTTRRKHDTINVTEVNSSGRFCVGPFHPGAASNRKAGSFSVCPARDSVSHESPSARQRISFPGPPRRDPGGQDTCNKGVCHAFAQNQNNRRDHQRNYHHDDYCHRFWRMQTSPRPRMSSD